MFSDDPLYRKGRLKTKNAARSLSLRRWWNGLIESVVDAFADDVQIRP